MPGIVFTENFYYYHDCQVCWGKIELVIGNGTRMFRGNIKVMSCKNQQKDIRFTDKEFNI